MAGARFRIRRCNGNREAWILVTIRDDGKESDVYGSFITALSIDGLFLNPRGKHLRPPPGQPIELLWEV